ncbi:MAG: permease [Bacillota bacterium]
MVRDADGRASRPIPRRQLTYEHSPGTDLRRTDSQPHGPGRSRSIAGYLVGAALGAVTPFCSCSTIPIVAGLLRSGAPFGPTMAFLISSRYCRPSWVLGIRYSTL